ncbi:MAG: amino acid ABC transporter permease [Candidatus Delongbacteria bacterium]|nr:amino acid ABC transporter permease [Candidatus Delongbacteria bacterium]MBN2836930.1 amino acid ABC transporter permease [Candidatus Delongbacteria bacterium]
MKFLTSLSEYMPYMLDGLVVTIKLTIISAIVGFIIGVPLVLGTLYGGFFFKNISKLYITLIRGTPLLVQLFFIYYGLPAIGFNMTPYSAALLGFVLNSAAYQAEYMKGGFLAITTEQMEASFSIGLSKWQSIRYVIFPQAFRFSIPSLSNEIIYLIKYTSIAYIIQVEELFAQAKFFASDTYYYLEIFITIGIVYLLMIYIITMLTNILEKKLYIPGFDISHLK